MRINSPDRRVDDALKMQESAFKPRPNDGYATQSDRRFYVVDEDCNVVLVGSSPNDLVPAAAPESRLPLDVDRAVRGVMAPENFGGGFARASTGSKSLRVLLLSGPAGNFYGVVARDRTRISRSRAS